MVLFVPIDHELRIQAKKEFKDVEGLKTISTDLPPKQVAEEEARASMILGEERYHDLNVFSDQLPYWV